MPTDTRLLTLVQWLSPSFPIGAFAYSHGLETAIRDGRITDAGSLENWLGDVLQHGSGRSDLILLRLAFVCSASELRLLNDEARAYAPSAERLREADRQGRAFATAVRDVWDLEVPDAVLPLAVGYAGRLAGIGIDTLAPLYVHAFIGNLVSAAVRSVPLGQTVGQGVVARLAPLCAKIAEDTHGCALDDLASAAFLSDIATMRHETLEPRIFQS